ncbi:MAG: lyase family protein, partial [Vulcanimicrobiaceae bacterium]
IVPTPLAIDRPRLADLLGLGEPAIHSLYSYLNGEVYVDALSAASLTASSISRMLLDLWWWASDELSLVRFADEWCGGSFIMPHKRNPSWMKACRFATINVKAKHNEAQELWMHGTPMFLVASLPIPGIMHEGFGTLRFACELLSGALKSAEIDVKRAREVTEEDYVQSSQLVSLIVGNGDAGWRQAEHVVGALVKEAIDAKRPPQSVTYDRMLEIGREQLGKTLTVKREAFEAALDVKNIVASRGDCGPAPNAVRAAIKKQRERISELQSWTSSEQERVAKNWAEVERLARAI